ncbi:MAG: VOC family protein [Pseudomonadota bacterium]|uniref:VOC family protein n=1 Tax=Sphingomonas sp. ERG5 TaxID=1381597 RepID=UPI000ACD3703|nr:VOC family protein [Sphingomonas sp. ERG5]
MADGLNDDRDVRNGWNGSLEYLPPKADTGSNVGRKRVTDYTPEGRHSVTPRLITPDVAELVDFMRAVFDAQGDYVPERPAELRIGDSIIMVSDGGGIRPSMPGFFYLYVPDTDATFQAAISAGAVAIELPGDMPWGDRRATVADRWGNLWQIATYLGVGG